MLEITSFRSKKRNDRKHDTKSGTICNRSVPFPCEQAMRCSRENLLVKKKANGKIFALNACVDVVVAGKNGKD